MKPATLLATGLVSLTMACAPVEKPPIIGFQTQGVGDLVLQSDEFPTVVYTRSGVPPLSDYRRFIIDAVSVNYDDPGVRELSQDDVDRISTYFRTAVVKELLDGGYEVGTRTQPDTLRVSLTISGFSAPESGGLVNAAGIVAASAIGLPGVVALSVGEVTIEATFREATTNRLDAAVLSRSRGSRVLNDSPWSTWSDVEGSLDAWAEDFRGAVDEAHGKR